MNTPTVLTQPITPEQLQPLLDKEILFHASYSMGTATGNEQVFTQAGYLKRISPSGKHVEIVIGVSESWVPLEKITMIELLDSLEPNMPPSPDSCETCVICGQEITAMESYGVGRRLGCRYHWDCLKREAATVSPDCKVETAADPLGDDARVRKQIRA